MSQLGRSISVTSGFYLINAGRAVRLYKRVVVRKETALKNKKWRTKSLIPFRIENMRNRLRTKDLTYGLRIFHTVLSEPWMTRLCGESHRRQ
jgi:hypothetical protein